MIQIRNLSKSYRLYSSKSDRVKEALSLSGKKYHKEFFALSQIDATISEGEVVGIIGNNGSGKSTLLKLITGVVTPTSGHLAISQRATALLEIGAGFNPELTGMQNIYLNASIDGYTSSRIDAMVDSIVSFADIGEFIYQPVKSYSSGMKSRLAFSLSIHVEPKLLIVDEVLSVGDAAFARKCFAKIEEFKKNGVTILFVSHAISQVVGLCDRVFWLHRGQKVLDGDTKLICGLYQKYAEVKELDFQKVRAEYEKLLSESSNNALSHKERPTLSYNPKIKTKSLIAYEQNGAFISNVRVLDSKGNEANIVYKNQSYSYSYDVLFDDFHKEVNLAILLKSKNGVLLGGKELKIYDVKKSKTYAISWRFNSILNEGEYFFNSGVNVVKNGEKVILHRIIDAYMVTVLHQKDESANNFIDFGFEMEVSDE